MTSKNLFYGFSIFFGLLFSPSGALTESSTEKFKREQEIVRVQMVQISRELGVTCTECHSSKNWKDGSKSTFKVAKEHLKTVEILRANGFDGKKFPEASCFTCHQGKLKFASKMQHPEAAPKPADTKEE